MNNKSKELTAKNTYEFGDLCEIMKLLRAPGGCPWDREQTHKSIRTNLIEEAYEAAEAIDINDDKLLCEELGDLMLQTVFHAQMADEAGEFNISDVINGICKKLIIRHPHIFSDICVNGSADVLRNWDKIKYESKKLNPAETLDAVCTALPALMRAQKLAKRAEAAGGYISPYEKRKLSPDDTATKACELGERLFELAQEARAYGVDAEEALEVYNKTFVHKIKNTL